MNDTTCKKQFNKDAVTLLRLKLKECDTFEDYLASVDELSNDDHYLLDRDAIELDSPLSASDADGNNAIALFTAVGAIDRVNATIPGLWTYLAFNTCRQYMLERWNPGKSGNWRQRVKDRWLLPIEPNRGNLVRHGIARLWWAAELTIDDSCEHVLSREKQDPYAYTRWIFEVEDRWLQLFDRSVGQNSEVLWAVLDSMQKDRSTPQSALAKAVGRDLLLAMSTRRLDVLPPDELRNAVDTIREEASREVLASRKK
ncbi:hypothetical protein PSRA_1007 [Pseudoscardovia radai]|uniref:Uncharacterized protein n=1 Tax=Pseudoscardovia radai TaxID=987066 RepID=A0A261EXL1_9BIFI|nr:DUF6339 family protein [Pseudoscardovia radai]OZG51610.1 hypothetical protein PSRA_1007 [Pseudoscardovia radai]